jgi:hypothetical protein
MYLGWITFVTTVIAILNFTSDKKKGILLPFLILKFDTGY